MRRDLERNIIDHTRRTSLLTKMRHLATMQTYFLNSRQIKKLHVTHTFSPVFHAIVTMEFENLYNRLHARIFSSTTLSALWAALLSSTLGYLPKGNHEKVVNKSNELEFNQAQSKTMCLSMCSICTQYSKTWLPTIFPTVVLWVFLVPVIWGT